MKKSILLVLAGIIGLTGCTQKEEKKAMLAVSFGTSYEQTRKLTIETTEDVLKAEYPDMDFYSAFTAQTIIDILETRDNIKVFNVKEALEEIKKEKYTEVYIQPLHVMNGYEYEELESEVKNYEEYFDKVKLGKPLLTYQNDYELVVENFKNIVPANNEALVFVGHGTHHEGGSAYSMMEHMFHSKGYKNVFMGTVEGYPSYDEVLSSLKDNGYSKVYLSPFMLVAGDHYENDIAGDEADSWKTMLSEEGFEVEVIGKGLGEYPEIRDIFLNHLKIIASYEK